MTDRIEELNKLCRGSENALIGSMLVNDEAVAMALEELHDWHFQDRENRGLFEAMSMIDERGETITVTALRRERLDQGGPCDARYLAGLMDRSEGGNYVGTHVRVLKERASLLEITRVCNDTVRKAGDMVPGRADLSGLLDELSAAVMESGSDPSVLTTQDLKGAIAEAMKEVEKAQEYHAPPGIQTGIDGIDKITGGFRPGEMSVVAADTGEGKSVFALQMARHAARCRWDHLEGRRAEVLYFCTEMRKPDVAKRLLAAEGDIAIDLIRDGRLGQDEMLKLAETAADLGTLPMVFDTQKGLTIQRLGRMARHQRRLGKLDLMVVDLLTQVRPGKRIDSREQQVAYVSAELAALGVELDVPILATAQINRNQNQRAASDKDPILNDLRESAAIGQDADVVLFLHRAKDWESERIKAFVRKHRNGKTGNCEFRRAFRTQKFLNPPGDGKQFDG